MECCIRFSTGWKSRAISVPIGKSLHTGRKRKYYSLTSEGNDSLEDIKSQWRLVNENLEQDMGNGFLRYNPEGVILNMEKNITILDRKDWLNGGTIGLVQVL